MEGQIVILTETLTNGVNLKLKVRLRILTVLLYEADHSYDCFIVRTVQLSELFRVCGLRNKSVYFKQTVY